MSFRVTPPLQDEADEVRLAPRAGFDPPDKQFYRESAQHSKMAKWELLRGYNIHHADYEEAEHFAEHWLIKHNAYTLDFSKEENHEVRGELLDALEDNYSFFNSRQVP